MKTAQVVNLNWESEAGTVYGGHFVVNEDGSVDLTVDYPSNAKVDLGAMNWSRYQVSGASFYRFETFFTTSYGAPVNKKNGNSNLICDAFATEMANPGVDQKNNTIKGNVGNAMVYIRCDSITDAAEFKTAMSGIYAYYEPTTAPQTYHLDSIEQITTLLGLNNIWCDIAPLDITYRVNPADVASIIPDAPSADGTYTLKVTVSGGVATYSWVSA